MSDSHTATTALVIERPAERAGLAPLVAAILKQNPNAETLQQLLALQREYDANEARKAYTTAVVGLKRDLPTVIARDKLVKFGTTQYTHTSLAEVMDKITGPLTAHGFSLAWKPSTGPDGVTVTCRLTHSDGHYEEATISAPADMSGSKSKPQGVASTITLLSRYTALALLGIATADMKEPEGEADAAPDASRVDSKRNISAATWLAKKGKSREDAEKLVGRKVAAWTGADLDTLKAWAVTEAAVVCANLC